MVDLSIVIAAYNEEKRLPQTLERYFGYFKTAPHTYEIVIVDDGSRDRTKRVIEELAGIHPELRLLSHFPNRGRGVSIREGVLDAQGEIILETDADGSVDNEAIGRFLEYFKRRPEIDAIFGSRELPDSKVAKRQPWLRVFLGKGFIVLAKILFRLWGTTDFTLGFKMFRKEASQDVFSHQFDSHFLAEAEIVFVSHRRGWHTVELPVTWTDNRDSRVRPLRDSLRSLKGLSKVLWRDTQGKYKR
jgi:dolichyl-phosphate beta-glucosyltransferase